MSGVDPCPAGTSPSLFCNDCAVTWHELSILVTNLNINPLFTGLVATLTTRVNFLALRVAIYQQISWFLGFVFIIIILVYADILSGITGTVLVIIILVLALVLTYLSYLDLEYTLSQVGVDLLNRANTNRGVTIGEYLSRIFPLISQAQMESGVPCTKPMGT